ncbi:ferredoxin reductase family protein [Pseudothauera lacus]|uniref:Ferric reductase n=1 Tax=Pseudothauera lacus TaxID=2136175 RepID=A0A2T4ICS1_9RHOO|nr:ferric reductase-like transmembrane domain-containing protein [Pseudothauera lacus]PTD95561.1 ferric reductase [Pseudothauera lacus]
MPVILWAFVASVVALWGVDAATSGAGAGSLPWVVRTQGLYLSGLLSIAMMSLAMVLATRPVWLERPLGGMDRIYRQHKWAGILAGVFALLHWLVEMSDGLIKSVFGRGGRPAKESFAGWFEGLRDAGEELGEFAIYLLLAMVVLSLLRRFPYKFWRHLHRAMPVLYLMLAFHAAVLAPVQWWQQPVGLLMAGLLAAGSVAALCSLSGRVGRGRQARGQVVSVNRPAADVTSVVCRLEGDWRGHRAGQFAFVTFERFEGAHPFTIASADSGDRTVRFEIKALGDYTRSLPQRLQAGMPVTVEGPYGRFELDRRDHRARQVWVAGGIGVTPFLAWLSALQSDPRGAPEADLHYCTRDAAKDPFAERLRGLCEGVPSIRLHVHDGARGDHLTAAQLHGAPGGTRLRTEVWFCGPQGLADQLRRGLAGEWRVRFHQEAFEMR